MSTKDVGSTLVKMLTQKGVVQLKYYIALFIYLCTKALHLQLVKDMTTGSFITILQRFISICGKPNVIYSDNGTNFIDAYKELKNLLTVEN